MQLLVDIREHLRGIRWEAERQTELLAVPTDLAKAEENDRKASTWQEAAPAPKAITWQEAARCLRDVCKNKGLCECDPFGCPMWSFCERYLQGGGVPEGWEVPGDE